MYRPNRVWPSCTCTDATVIRNGVSGLPRNGFSPSADLIVSSGLAALFEFGGAVLAVRL